MMNQIVTNRSLIPIALLALLVSGYAARAQDSLVSPQQLLSQGVPRGNTSRAPTKVSAPCVQPQPILELQDYDGPFQKTVGLFARKLDRKAVHPQHFEPGLRLCALDVKDKFYLFVHDTFDPVTFLTAGFNAGMGQAMNQDPTFGQGAAGYGKRFGTDFVDQVSFDFFKDFAYPSLFSEDPRYYRLSHGSGGRRLWHAVNHAFLAYQYNGDRMFNISEWMGTTSEVVLGNLYHPGNQRGFAPAASQVGYDVLEDVGLDALREFWPEIARKLNLPFRTESDASHPAPQP
jgi:hypothetical protein